MVKRTTKSGGDMLEVGSRGVASLQTRLQKRFGNEAATVLGGEMISGVKDWLSTQNPLLDAAIGHPGIPVGRITTFIGDTSSGKTTQAYHLFAETQRRGGIAILIDAEFAALDPDRAEVLGVNPEELLVMQPETLEAACNQIEEAIKFAREDNPGTLVTIVLDSVAGLATKAESEGEYGAHHMAGHAKIMGQALRKMARLIADQSVVLVIINQYREKIGVMFGPSKTMLAEHPIRFASSLVVEFVSAGKVTEGEGVKKVSHGITTRGTVSKSKVGRPHGVCLFQILWDRGIDMSGGLFTLALQGEVIQKPSAGWYQYGEQKFRESAWEEILQNNPDIVEKILEALPDTMKYPKESKMHNPNASDEVIPLEQVV